MNCPSPPRLPIAFTIPGDDRGLIHAKADMRAYARGVIQPHMFVYIQTPRGNVICQVRRVSDAGMVPQAEIIKEVRRLESAYTQALTTNIPDGIHPDPVLLEQTFKVLHLDPIGIINGKLDEYVGGVGYMQCVYRATSSEISQLYPEPKGGLRVGYVADGCHATEVAFSLAKPDLARHGVIYGKNGVGKTNALKLIALLNVTGPEPVPVIIFGHPDIGMDNPNDEGTKGLIGLNHPQIVHFGYEKLLRVHTSEIALDQVYQSYEWTQAQRYLIREVYDMDPATYVTTLASYDEHEDPLKLIFTSERSGSKRFPKVSRHGYATVRTVNVVKRRFRELARIVDDTASPLLPQIVQAVLDGKTILINTFDVEAEQQAILVKLILHRLQDVGIRSYGRTKALRLTVMIDEAQAFIEHVGEELTRFLKGCRKNGISLFLSTQSPSNQSLPPEVKNEIHNIIAFSLNPDAIPALAGMSPDLANLKEVITHRAIGQYMGVAAVVTRSQRLSVIVKFPRFEDELEKYLGSRAPDPEEPMTLIPEPDPQTVVSSPSGTKPDPPPPQLPLFSDLVDDAEEVS